MLNGISALAVTINQNANAEQVGGNLIDKLLTYASYGGVVLAIFGGVNIAIGLASPDAPPSQKMNGVYMVIGGAVLVGLRILLRSLGVIG